MDRHPEVANQMRAAYDGWWKATRPMMINEGVPMSPTRPFHEQYREQMRTTGIPDWQPPEL
jgi:arylsulfatase